MAVSAVLSISYNVISSTLGGVLKFMKWFYFDFLPFIIQYIAAPLFILGILLALAFAGGTVLFTITFFIFIYFFIKHTIFVS
jgi:hypothetical protein